MHHLDAALLYADVGWRVFPLGDASKRPLTARGYLDATTDEQTIRQWWSVVPDARIGLALRPSGLLAVDVDPRNGGTVTFANLEVAHGALPRACHQRSGSGGEHVVMRDPSPGPTGWTRRQEDGGSIVGKLGAGVDLKCNGYIVVAPSGKYEWLAVDPTNVPDVPEAWQAIMRKADVEGASISMLAPVGIEEWEETVVELTAAQIAELRAALDALPAPRQGRNATFQAIKTVFHDFGLSTDDGMQYLLEWHEHHGNPRSAAELKRQVQRAADRPSERERGYRVVSLGVEFTAFSDFVRRVGEKVAAREYVKRAATFAVAGATPRPRGATVSQEEYACLLAESRALRLRPSGTGGASR